jgi:hypothetical protein
MEKKELNFLKVRNKLILQRKVLCTGNPNSSGTIASGIKEIYPNTTFIHLSKGYDFWNLGNNLQSLEKLFQSHNTFINASYVKGAQINLLDLCYKNMKFGDVFNIGSTHEYGNIGHETYKLNKLKLRERSLELDSFRFQTCHIIVGGIDDGSPTKKEQLKPIQIAELIKWITLQKFKMPLVSIESPKQPW